MPGPNAAMLATDLIAALEDIVATYGDTATVGAAHQATYPLRLDVVGIATTTDLPDNALGDDLVTPDNPAARIAAEAELPTAWLVLDQSNAHDVNPYAPAALWEVMSPVT